MESYLPSSYLVSVPSLGRTMSKTASLLFCKGINSLSRQLLGTQCVPATVLGTAGIQGWIEAEKHDVCLNTHNSDNHLKVQELLDD